MPQLAGLISQRSWRVARIVALITMTIAGCARDTAPPAIDLTGAGATFPYPLYRRWFADYAARTGVRINYLSVGSAAGIRLLDSATVDFGAIDRPLTAAERGGSACPRVAIPTVAGAIAVVYNLPEQSSALRLDADLLADIFTGVIRRWDDRAIAARNPGVELPGRAISVVHRAPGSGTSRAFAAYLASSRKWKPRGDLEWSTGVAVEGNEGVGAQVHQTVGAIGYAEVAYATLYHLQVALVRNAHGEDVLPSDVSIRGAVDSALVHSSADSASLILSTAPRSYPIATLTWLVFDPGTLDASRRAKVVSFIRWALHNGAASADRLEYVPLPPAAVTRYDSALTTLSANSCHVTPP